MELNNEVLRKAMQLEKSWFALKEQHGDSWLVMTKSERKLLIDKYIEEHYGNQNVSSSTK